MSQSQFFYHLAPFWAYLIENHLLKTKLNAIQSKLPLVVTMEIKIRPCKTPKVKENGDDIRIWIIFGTFINLDL